jgi:hypothetical protein
MDLRQVNISTLSEVDLLVAWLGGFVEDAANMSIWWDKGGRKVGQRWDIPR